MSETEERARITMRYRDVQEMFDICVGSLDFGSGFLSTDQVKMLRRVAKRIGVDPKKATPESHRMAFGYPCPHCIPSRDYFCHTHRAAVPEPEPMKCKPWPDTVINIVGDFATGREVTDADSSFAGSEPTVKPATS